MTDTKQPEALRLADAMERYIVLQLGLMWDDKIDAAIADQEGNAA